MGVIIKNTANLARATHIDVKAVTDRVSLKIGNVELEFGYADAFKLAAWIQYRAREAKGFAGDHSTHWRLLGQLHDAGEGPGVPLG